MVVHSIDTIVSDPERRGGEPFIVDTQIRVVDLVASHLYRRLTPDELAINFNLDLGQVYAALAYYYQHKGDIDEAMKMDAKEAQSLIKQLSEQGKLINLE